MRKRLKEELTKEEIEKTEIANKIISALRDISLNGADLEAAKAIGFLEFAKFSIIRESASQGEMKERSYYD